MCTGHVIRQGQVVKVERATGVAGLLNPQVVRLTMWTHQIGLGDLRFHSDFRSFLSLANSMNLRSNFKATSKPVFQIGLRESMLSII